jgi:PAS domain S-box-containing protein
MVNENIKAFFSAPTFPDEEKGRAASVLNIIIWGVIGVLILATALGLPLFFAAKVESAILLGAFAALLLFDRWLMRRGLVRAAAILLIASTWSLTASLILLTGGIMSANLALLLPIAALSGLLLGWRWAVGAASASSILALALALLEGKGFKLPSPFPAPPLSRWFELSLSFAILLIPMILWIRYLRRSAASARRALEERLSAEQALKNSEERFHTIYDSISEAVFIHSTDGRILEVNKKMTEMYGWDAQDVTAGLDIAALSSNEGPYTQESAMEWVRRACRGENPVFEWHARRKDGSLFWVEVSMRMAILDGNHVLLVTARDIGERIQARAERERLEADLMQSQKMESVGRLAGGIAHDFNNILTGILGNLELGLLHNLDGETRSCLEAAKRSCLSASELTHQLLAFSRKQLIRPRVLDLGALVEMQRPMLSRLLGESITLECDFRDSPWRVFADPAQLEHLIVNLAVNARDAMPSGGRLRLSVEKAIIPPGQGAMPEGDYVLFTVSDDGQGMEPAVLARIFEPFFTTKERGKGTGLGLAIVFGIVNQNGGYIQADSQPGRGSTFRIYLPRREGEPAPLDEPIDVQGVPGGRETILVVEDDPIVLDVAMRALAKAGYVARGCVSAEEALEILPGLGHLDLLVTDVILPGLDGRAMAERILAQRPGLKLLYVSGYPNEILAVRGVLDPGLHLLPKPFSPQDLLAAIRSTLDGKAIAANQP